VVAQRSCRDQRQYINTYRGHETFLHHCAVLREGIAAGADPHDLDTTGAHVADGVLAQVAADVLTPVEWRHGEKVDLAVVRSAVQPP
jgi:hypothetical protein